MSALIPLLAFAIWALGHLFVNPRPNAGRQASTADAIVPRRHEGLHAANRKRAKR